MNTLVCPGFEFEIRRPIGLNLRCLAQVVLKALEFRCAVRIAKGQEAGMDAKSFLSVLNLLPAPKGTRLKVEAEGEGAQACLEALEQVLRRELA